MRRLVLGLVWLLGCAAQGPEPVPLGGGGHWSLQAPETYGGPLEARQKLTLHQGGETRQLIVLLAIEGRRLHLTGLGPLGAPLVSLELGPEGLSQTALVPLGVEGRFILADLQLALWPRLEGLSGLKLEQGPGFRRLSGPEGPVWEARYRPRREGFERLEIVHHLRGYRIEIEPLD